MTSELKNQPFVLVKRDLTDDSAVRVLDHYPLKIARVGIARP